jgi:hypothetical protein
MFPYYRQEQIQVQVEKKQKNTCSFCGSYEHYIRDCNQVGITLHQFVNTEDQEQAILLIQTRGIGLTGLQKLLQLLGIHIAGEKLSKYELLKLLEARWVQIRRSLGEMILKDETIRTVKTITLSRTQLYSS